MKANTRLIIRPSFSIRPCIKIILFDWFCKNMLRMISTQSRDCTHVYVIWISAFFQMLSTSMRPTQVSMVQLQSVMLTARLVSALGYLDRLPSRLLQRVVNKMVVSYRLDSEINILLDSTMGGLVHRGVYLVGTPPPGMIPVIWFCSHLLGMVDQWWIPWRSSPYLANSCVVASGTDSGMAWMVASGTVSCDRSRWFMYIC